MFSIINPQHENFSLLATQLFKKAELFNCLATDLGAAYSQAYYQKDYRNISSLITFKDQPVMVLLLTEFQNNDQVFELNYYGMPSNLVIDAKASKEALEGAFDLMTKSFSQFIENKKIELNYISDQATLNTFEILLLASGAKSKQKFSQFLNIEPALEDIKREVRKSYKSLINWGFKNINFTVLDQDSVTVEKFMAFKDLHIQVAGRQTRSDETWLKQVEMIKNNEAFAILGELDGKLVTASLFNYFQDHCYYSVSASIRELFDKPLLHSSIWRAIEIAKSKGCKEFELGEQVFPSSENVSKKEVDISYFKRGFGGRTKIKTLFNLTV